MKALLLLLCVSSFLLASTLNISKDNSFFDNFTIQRYEDKTLSLDIEKIQKITDFTQVSNSFTEGYTSSVFWYKFDIYNDTNNSMKMILDTEKLLIEVDLYVVGVEGIQHYKGGNRVPIKERIIQSTTTRFPLFIQPKERQTIYLRVRHITTLYSTLRVMDEKSFMQFDLFTFQWLGLMYGGILFLMLYNFFLFLSLKDKVYLYYVLYVGSFLSWWMMAEGYSPFTSISGDIFYTIAANEVAMFVIFIILFSRELLLSKKIAPTLDKYLDFSLWIMILSLAFNFYDSVYIIYTVNTLGQVVLFLLFIIAIKSYKSGNKIALFYLLAQVVFFIVMTPFLLMTLNLFPNYSFLKHLPLLGSLYETVVFSFALAYRLKLEMQTNQNQQNVLSQQAKLASMGEMINTIAHQWRQPLNRINSSISVLNSILRRNIVDNKMTKLQLQMIEENTKYMSDTIDDFSNFFHPRKIKTIFSLKDTTEQALRLLISRTNDIEINVVVKSDIKLYSYEKEYLQVLLTILNNAIDNFEIKEKENPTITITIQRYEKMLTLCICDNGGGVAEKEMKRIFDPYYTTKFSKEGSGLGLYMAKMLIEKSIEGKLLVKNQDSGACFEIIVPIK